MGKVIGIDLGTTNSVVAVMEGGTPIVIANEEGDRTTPSVVGYTDDGERLIGTVAKRQAITNPERTIYSIKRFMGRRFEEVYDERRLVAYNVVPGPAGDCRIVIKEQLLSPPEIAAQVLMKLRRAAEDYLGERVQDAVITVPAYFNDAQRQATKDAGKIAGLDVRRIVNEPTAAAMAYGMDKKKGERIAIYDFGGGTFDISILEVGDDVVRVLATNGDTHLGGDDIDDRVVQWLLDEFAQESGIDVSADKSVLQLLKDTSEKAKIELSFAHKRNIHLPFLAVDHNGAKHLTRELTRAHLEELMEDIIERTLEPTRQCLADARLKPADIDHVVLVGGSTRIPRVQQLVKSLFGREPTRTVNPDEVVAVGAAVQAGVLTGEVQDLLLLDVTPLSLGVETLGGLTSRILERNTTIPVRETEVFTTAIDGQTSVQIHVLQGERDLAKDNRTLGRFHLTDMPLAPAGIPQIEVTFDIDANGIVNVTARDKATGSETAIQISHSSGLSQQDIERMLREARQHEEDDKERRQTVEAHNSAEQLMRQAEQFLRKNEATMGASGPLVRSSMARLRSAMGGRDTQTLRMAIEHLRTAVFATGESMYAAAGAPLATYSSGGSSEDAA